jgi:hypothetical protein
MSIKKKVSSKKVTSPKAKVTTRVRMTEEETPAERRKTRSRR